MSFRLRQYQREALEAVLAEYRERQSTLVVMPTGVGKTILFAHLIAAMLESGRAMVLAHVDELIRQAYDKIKRCTGLDIDVEKADEWADRVWSQWRAPVIVSSVQTQNSGRVEKRRMHRFRPADFGIVVADEAHHYTAATFRRVIDHYRSNPTTKVFGCTATPNRHDEAALGQIFEGCAYNYALEDAQRDGWLVPVMAEEKFLKDWHLEEIKTTAGELNGAQLARETEREAVVAPMATHTYEACRDGKALVFCASVAHAERFGEILNRYESGCARSVSGKTPQDQRRQIIADYARGEFRFLCNCALVGEGFDDPGIQYVVMGKPTKSLPAFTQMLGRGTRPLAGVVDGIEDEEQEQLPLNGDPSNPAALRRKAIAQSSKATMCVIDFVGNKGRHKIISAVDVLGGRYTDAVIERAERELRKSGKRADVDEILKRAEEAERKSIEAAERRKAIRYSAHYDTRRSDIFASLGMATRREPAWVRGRLPSQPMIAFLERHSPLKSGEIGKLTFHEAGALIGDIKARWTDGRCTQKQAKLLVRFGFRADLKRDEAKPLIDLIAANGWRWPNERPKPAEFLCATGSA